PLGFTCPVTLGPKVLLQECWKLKVSWDTELPASISKKFERWRKELSKLNKIEIPRCLIPGRNAPGNLTFHVFCDASKIAYTACVFLRCESENSTTCQLIQARCRVAPMKSLSIPRLELLACSIGARLSQSVSSDMKLENLPKIFWSDSADALYWIKGSETWAPFVYNRVKEIRSLTNTEDWYHVPGPLNAADLPSRGCSVETLAMSRWWEGMDWLKRPPEEWPKSNVTPDFDIINSEKRKTVISAANHEGASEEKYYNRFSSYDRLLRVTAWMYRFFTNCKIEKSNRIIGVLTLEEMNRAEIAVLKIVQKESFSGTDDKRLKAIQCYVDPNDDVNDLTPLTPSMFLHDLKQEGIPDLDILYSSSLNKRHAYRQRVKQDLRKRFRTEYLGHLRQSSKFDKNQKPLQIGDIVLVSSDNTKRIEWPLAKVMEYPSKDGSIRLVKVKMKSGEFLRPVLRLIPLEVTQKVDLGKPPVDRIFPTNEPTVQLTGKECSSETIPDEPDVQRTVNDFSSETVPEKRSRYGRLIKQIVRI
ncbi:integrase catalytic domain-containing protein, partial [Trichonephila inaurata madagascariensis]